MSETDKKGCRRQPFFFLYSFFRRTALPEYAAVLRFFLPAEPRFQKIPRMDLFFLPQSAHLKDAVVLPVFFPDSSTSRRYLRLCHFLRCVSVCCSAEDRRHDNRKERTECEDNRTGNPAGEHHVLEVLASCLGKGAESSGIRINDRRHERSGNQDDRQSSMGSPFA